MNQNFLKPNPCYVPNSSSFDQYQPSQSLVTQQLPQRSNEDIQLEMAKLIKNNRILSNNNIFPHEEASMEVLLAKERILKLIQAWDEKQIESWSLPALLLQLLNDSQSIDVMLKQFEQAANLAVQQEQEEQAAQSFNPNWNFSMINDDEEHSIQYKEYLKNSSNAIAPVLPTKEPEYSLSMGYGHLNTISETESDEVIKSSVKNLVPILNEYEVTFDDESECDVLIKDESSLIFTTFSNPLFDCNDDFTSSDDESLSNEDVPMENFKVYLNPLFDDEEISSEEIDPHYLNTKSDLIESLSNHDILIDSSSMFDYLDEFFAELMPTSIVNEERIKREHEEYISLMDKLLAINSFPRPLENFHANTIIETLPSSPIFVEDSDSFREEIDIFTGTDDLLPPGNRSTNLYIINLHEMASASLIFLMARATSTKSWLWHKRLSHLNFDTINDLAKNDLVTGLPKFKYHKEHLCLSCETPQQNVVMERRNQTLVESARTMLIFSRASLFLWAEAIATACYTQNRSIIHRRFNKTPYELINGRKPDISFLYVFGALCCLKNDREDIGKLGAKGDIGFFIGYSTNSCAYRVFNRRTKKIMETMNVTFDELLAMAFEQSSLKPRLQSMTSGQISSGLDLTYALSTITTQQPTKGELDLLFEAMYDDYIGGQPSATSRIAPAAQAHLVRQTLTESTIIADTTSSPSNSSSQATKFPNTS
nr:retrovirus-related Pol polyprotein from transposon TNT 1-94 [Tanacetum cinerariifolium]